MSKQKRKNMKDSKKQEYVDLLHRTICGQIHVCSERDHCRSEDWSINRSTHERVLVEEGGAESCSR